METVEAPVKAPAKKEKKLRKIMIINSKATIDSVYAALILANGARMEGIESEIFCTFFGLEMLQKDKMDHLHVATVGNPGLHIPTMIGGLPGMETLASTMMRKEMDKLDIPPVSEFLEIYKASGGKVFACKLAMEMFHLEKKDLWDDLDEVLTVGDFYNRADEEGTQIIFV
ncbi:DsrE/DsrF/DrsH-like family protein [Imperialibacter roseus]|uniref:DsrE/DsrF/DrsH-like family protein n=1 Tax=Imperialibacter roseus TaxID=1324217 RepID=A0ABZ0IVC4_9BACT|nr:DsrE/DsrF/DrsH-like family protein [Imperialibacter roseus]WOK08457.1 DsrE/DsrF/DrsH-like family protein [Imperialibacter roseus]